MTRQTDAVSERIDEYRQRRRLRIQALSPVGKTPELTAVIRNYIIISQIGKSDLNLADCRGIKILQRFFIFVSS